MDTPPRPTPLRGPGVHPGEGAVASVPHAHRVRLYGALDAVRVPLDVCDVQAVFRLAELDCLTVQTVIDWISAARRLGERE
ncbi:hypothetical protein [Streptomyces anandii]|uniref:hypothetical protein n=1 Tax=Streptomyces anandii TaxID=285454 RepID=UPI001672BF43|nr:hypothetical protein [Streptomyces anandii]GGX97914.1 hypothetical protein GCM10010510_49260 [Streptomyces anandii JCM 4720]